MQAPFSRTAFALLAEQAGRNPDGLAVIAAAGNATFQQLFQRAGQVAATLRGDGIGRGDRVGLLVNNRSEWLEIFFGASALGATVVPFSTWSKASEIDFLLSDSKVRILFTLQRYGAQSYADDLAGLLAKRQYPDLERIVAVDGEPPAGWQSYTRYRQGAPLVDLAPGDGATAADPLVILYTSGSSNRPKAVPLDHWATIENGFNIGERQGLRPGDRVLVSIPLFWSYGAANALPAALSHGATMVLQGRFEPGEALDLIEQHQCTALYTLPAMTNALLAHPTFDRRRTKSLRTGVTIGAPQDLITAAEALGASEICNIYGSTETYGNCCVTWHHWPLAQRAKLQGPPLPGMRLRIRDPESGVIVGPGTPGNIEVAGYLTRGYLGDSARHNADVFTADGYFKSGDLGLLDADGTLSYLGRSSEMIKRSGINVSPAEVEEVLQQHETVGLAGVTGLPDEDKGERIIAFVVSRPGAELAVDALLAHCRDRLSSYKIPDEVRVSQALPLTPTGKLMRRELKALAASKAD